MSKGGGGECAQVYYAQTVRTLPGLAFLEHRLQRTKEKQHLLLRQLLEAVVVIEPLHHIQIQGVAAQLETESKT
jgi:hypothetical protein